MNKINLIGRLTKDIELKYAGEKQTAIATCTIAVNRAFEKDKADFINIKSFGKTAEVMAKYLGKGTQVGITGRLQINAYDNKEGKKLYFTEVIVEELTFCDKKKEQIPPKAPEGEEGFVPAENDDDLPF